MGRETVRNHPVGFPRHALHDHFRALWLRKASILRAPVHFAWKIRLQGRGSGNDSTRRCRSTVSATVRRYQRLWTFQFALTIDFNYRVTLRITYGPDKFNVQTPLLSRFSANFIFFSLFSLSPFSVSVQSENYCTTIVRNNGVRYRQKKKKKKVEYFYSRTRWRFASMT